MAPSPTKTALRRILEDHQSRLSVELDGLIVSSREAARSEFAEQLNQAVRRLCISPGNGAAPSNGASREPEELAVTLLDAVAQFATCAALFRIAGDTATGERVRGVSEPAAEAFAGLDTSLSSAAALAGAIESRDPVTAVTTATQVSAPLFDLFEHTDDGRVSIYPVVVRDQVPALVYAWGTVQGPVVELLTQVAAAVWSAIPEPVKPVEPVETPELISIAPAAAPEPPVAADAAAEPARALTWDSLSPEDQQIHLRAQRFARVQVAEMRLFEGDAVQAGRTQRDLYSALQKSVDAARETFRNQFFASCTNMVDYLDLELTRTLANDDPDLLGKSYPGPLVH